MTNRVYVVGRDRSVERLFEERGWDVVSGDLPDSDFDLVVFTGGSDIDPARYGEENEGSSVSDYSRSRDEFEFGVYRRLRGLKIPKAGICRGGQLFNIANGGSMVQHIDGHVGSNHEVFLYDSSESIGKFNSCHHQMMIPTIDAEMIAYSLLPKTIEVGSSCTRLCPEVLYYEKSKDLCFQAHPEWGHSNTTEHFFTYIKQFFNLGN